MGVGHVFFQPFFTEKKLNTRSMPIFLCRQAVPLYINFEGIDNELKSNKAKVFDSVKFLHNDVFFRVSTG